MPRIAARRDANHPFVDEIHRFNKAQQDAFLPYVERGDIIPDRRDHRKSVVRSDFRAAFASKVYMLRALHPRYR